MFNRIRVAIVGLGNCASALVQGTYYYSTNKIEHGIVRPTIGNYGPDSIDFVVGFDVDARKVGLPINKAIYSLPNCCKDLCKREDLQGASCQRFGGPVLKAPLLDGVSKHMEAHHEQDTEHFFVKDPLEGADNDQLAQCASILKNYEVDVLVNYLPVGSEEATKFWANACLEAGVNMVNCIPVFIASDPIWHQKFADAKLSIIGDDMKSQFGASVLSQMLQELAHARGHKVNVHIQQNSGGNTDFLNMLNRERLASKKISKENVLKHHGIEPDFFHAGPSDYIKVYGDTKVAHFRLELEGFAGSPVLLDARLEVQDSPNSAGVVIDALRYVMVANKKGIFGSLEGPSAFTQKSPPKQMPLAMAIEACNALA